MDKNSCGFLLREMTGGTVRSRLCHLF